MRSFPSRSVSWIVRAPLFVAADVTGPAPRGLFLAFHVGAGHLIVHLRLDNPVRAVVLDRDEVRVV
jgi:hypothetical protein